MVAISASSVDTHTSLNTPASRAATTTQPRNGRPPSSAMFLRGNRFDPPRAGIRHSSTSDVIPGDRLVGLDVALQRPPDEERKIFGGDTSFWPLAVQHVLGKHGAFAEVADGHQV